MDTRTQEFLNADRVAVFELRIVLSGRSHLHRFTRRLLPAELQSATIISLGRCCG